MEDVTVVELSDLGFGPFFERQLQTLEGRQAIAARIAAEHRGAYEAWSASGAARGSPGGSASSWTRLAAGAGD
jgi:hypothetical protein